MKLEDIVNVATFPFRAVDDMIARQYTKVTQAWERKGKNKELLSGCIVATATFAPITPLDSAEYVKVVMTNPVYFPIFISGAIEAIENLLGGTGPEYVTESGDLDRKALPLIDAIQTFFRSPLFLVGATYLAKGVYDLVDYIRTGQTPLIEGVANLRVGYASLAVASSIYIRQSDSDILKRDSVVKQGYDAVMEKIPVILKPEPAKVMYK